MSTDREALDHVGIVRHLLDALRGLRAVDVDLVQLAKDGYASLDALSAEVARLQTERDRLERESLDQMQSKLDAQSTLLLITRALDLKLFELGNGWKKAAPKIIERIVALVDEGERGFTERDAAEADIERLRKVALAAEMYLIREAEEADTGAEYDGFSFIGGEQVIAAKQRLNEAHESLRSSLTLLGETCMCETTEDGWRPCPESLCERHDHSTAALAVGSPAPEEETHA